MDSRINRGEWKEEGKSVNKERRDGERSKKKEERESINN